MSKHVTSRFELEGRFLGFAAQDKLKYLRLATSTGEQIIKIPKDSRRSLHSVLVPGEWLSVTGWQERDGKKSVQLKADKVNRADLALAQPSDQVVPLGEARSETIAKSASQAKACILVCQKSDCCKRGSRQIAEALQEELNDRSLGQQVAVKGTGCMKRCKAGPNIVMPDKTRYAKICPEDVPTIFERHFPEQNQAGSVRPTSSCVTTAN